MSRHHTTRRLCYSEWNSNRKNKIDFRMTRDIKKIWFGLGQLTAQRRSTEQRQAKKICENTKCGEKTSNISRYNSPFLLFVSVINRRDANLCICDEEIEKNSLPSNGRKTVWVANRRRGNIQNWLRPEKERINGNTNTSTPGQEKQTEKKRNALKDTPTSPSPYLHTFFLQSLCMCWMVCAFTLHHTTPTTTTHPNALTNWSGCPLRLNGRNFTFGQTDRAQYVSFYFSSLQTLSYPVTRT